MICRTHQVSDRSSFIPLPLPPSFKLEGRTVDVTSVSDSHGVDELMADGREKVRVGVCNGQDVNASEVVVRDRETGDGGGLVGRGFIDGFLLAEARRLPALGLRRPLSPASTTSNRHPVCVLPLQPSQRSSYLVDINARNVVSLEELYHRSYATVKDHGDQSFDFAAIFAMISPARSLPIMTVSDEDSIGMVRIRDQEQLTKPNDSLDEGGLRGIHESVESAPRVSSSSSVKATTLSKSRETAARLILQARAKERRSWRQSARSN